MNRKRLGQLSFVAILLGVIIVAASWAASLPQGSSLAAAADEGEGGQRSISVSGTGTIYAKPDTAVINIGIETRNPKAVDAQRDNAARMDVLIKAVKDTGIAEGDIKTSNYSIYEDVTYNYENDSRQLNGYIVNNSLTVTLRDITQVSSLIDLAGQSGANSINGVYFTVSDDSEYYNEALKAAVQSAKDKGAVLASAGGAAMGQVLQMSEASYGGGVMRDMRESSSMAAPASGAPLANGTNIEAGTMEITANVTVTYAIQ